MRSHIFEQAVINRKVSMLINVADTDSVGSLHWITCETKDRPGKEGISMLKEILALCRKPMAKATIDYKVSLGCRRLNSCLRFATSKGLLIRQHGKYITTEKGQILVELFIKLDSFFGLNN